VRRRFDEFNYTASRVPDGWTAVKTSFYNELLAATKQPTASPVAPAPRYPGEDYFREHNPRIRQTEEEWEMKRATHCEKVSEEDAAKAIEAAKPQLHKMEAQAMRDTANRALAPVAKEETGQPFDIRPLTAEEQKALRKVYAKLYKPVAALSAGTPEQVREYRKEALEWAAQLVEQFTRFDHTTIPLVRPSVHAESRTEYLTTRITRDIRALAAAPQRPK